MTTDPTHAPEPTMPRRTMTSRQVQGMRSALTDVELERFTQHDKWGLQRHSWPQWLGILGEEFGEVCQAINQAEFGIGMRSTDGDIAAALAAIRDELIHTAAVAVAMIEHIDEVLT